MWLAKVREQTGQDIEVDWQPFSLAQVNNKEEGVVVWELPGAIDGSDPTLLPTRPVWPPSVKAKKPLRPSLWPC